MPHVSVERRGVNYVGVNYVYDEMPTVRSDGQEGEAPRSVHLRVLWLEIGTDDCQQVESLQCGLSLRSNG
jgi:hypothetical protein